MNSPFRTDVIFRGRCLEMSRYMKKSNAVTVVLIITLVVSVLAVGCFLIKAYNDRIRRSWEKEQEQAVADREELIAEYEQMNKDAVAAWEAEKEKLLNPPEEAYVAPTWPEAKAEGWDILDLKDYPLENVTMEQKTRADLMNNGMLLINEWHSRPDDFDESGIRSVGKYLGGNEKVQVNDYNISLFTVASDALLEAVNAAKEAGLTHYIVSEGYRSYETQNEKFQNRKAKIAANHPNYTDEELNKATKEGDSGVNYPGTSEFNSGLAFTLRLYDKSNSEVGSAKYSTTEQGIWMNENCWKYGLIFRFPLAEWPLPTTQDKHDKTGVSVAMNLYRYVGKGNAAFMHYLDFCMEEYIEYLHTHPHLALFEDGVLKYEVYCQYVGDADTFLVQLTRANAHVSSLDNMGYVITVFEH